MKDKNTAKALNHLYGFSNFADIVGLGVGAGSLAKFGIKEGVKSAAKKQFNNEMQSISIGDLVKSKNFIPINKERLPNYAHPNTSKSLAEDIHNIRLKRRFESLPKTDADGNTLFAGRVPYKAKSSKITYLDANENLDEYINFLYERYRQLNPKAPEEIIHDRIRQDLRSAAQGATSSGVVLTNKKLIDKIYGIDNLPIIRSHEVDHALHIPIRQAEGFDLDFLKSSIMKSNNPEYFNQLNNSELAARGTQLKNYFGLTRPDQEITEDMLKYAAQNYVKDTSFDNDMTMFFNSIRDWKKAAKWLSEASTAYTGLTTINNGK